MTKKNLILILLVIGLATVYMVWFTDWFRPATLRISHTNRASNLGMRRGNVVPNLVFRLNPGVRITELRVVPLAAYETNKNAIPVWHLISDSNSVPIENFAYGQFIKGMRPAVKGVRADELVTNVTYRMFVAAGRALGQHDFELH